MQSHADIIITNGLSHKVHLVAGEEHFGEICLKNIGSSKTKISIKQFDMAADSKGHITLIGPHQLPRSNAKWISFSPKQIEIDGNSKATIHYKINVPAEGQMGLFPNSKPNNPTGTFCSLIMVESGPIPYTIEEPNGNNVKLNINAEVQYGIQIITDIGKNFGQQLRFVESKLVINNSGKHLVVTAINAGELLSKAELRVELYDKDGSQLKTFRSKKNKIYPNAVLTDRFNMNNVPPGEYKAMVFADGNDKKMFERQFELNIVE
jgi:hypothetical protein